MPETYLDREEHRDDEFSAGTAYAWLNLRHPASPGVWVHIDYEPLTPAEARALAGWLLTAADRAEANAAA